eukprot:CAMPEP_0172310584 /NCGR_PEP_ID=MMETSP1058-20130122/11881_1 /TAXON_ID=83371 /ORGANISM="Detonula confervacea, Strain CCMP 353" /LENGTH=253 /DNA_ID=CAMNT_0013023433 /DNA_START=106 /DNA_END=867 /DNA_ORIENTATION=+
MRASTLSGVVPCTLFALTIGAVQSFLSAPGPLARHQPSSTSLMESSKPNELFDSPGWEAIRQELDQVPVFAVASAEGQPVKYRIEKKDEESFEVPLFYTHISDALVELEKAKENTPLPGMDINPYPLGGIFEMWANDSAIIVPNKKSMIQAGAPPNAIPMGQQVPLFACMEIAQEDEKGTPVLPLFFELDDATNAVSQAVSVDGGKAEDLEVVGLNLSEAVSLLANSKEKSTAFQFIPPASSLKHIRDYITGG